MTRGPEKIWPDFRFDQDNRLGSDHAERSAGVFLAIDRIVNLFDMAWKPLAQFAHPGRGGGGDDDFEVGHARFERTNQLSGDVHFAHADGVNPEHMPIRDGLFEAGGKSSEPLLETR